MKYPGYVPSAWLPFSYYESSHFYVKSSPEQTGSLDIDELGKEGMAAYVIQAPYWGQGGKLLHSMEKEHQETTADQRYWLHDYDAKESIRQIKRCENRKFESKVKCGLELGRTKFNISHGAWYPYLWKCGMSQPTASRRKQLATEFLQWREILPKDKELEEHHVIDALELITDKPFIMNDFRESRINREALRRELSGEEGIAAERKRSLKLTKVIKTVRTIYQQAWHDKEARNALEIIYRNVTLMWNDILRLEQMEKASRTEEFEKVRQ